MSNSSSWCRCGHPTPLHAPALLHRFGRQGECEMSQCGCPRFQSEPRGLWGRVLEALRPLPPD